MSTSRCHPVLAITLVAVLAVGCTSSSSGADDEQMAAWCDAAEDVIVTSEVFGEDPATVDPAELEEAVERAEVFFALPAQEAIRPQVEVLREPDSEIERIGGASQDLADYVERNGDGIDPALFEESP